MECCKIVILDLRANWQSWCTWLSKHLSEEKCVCMLLSYRNLNITDSTWKSSHKSKWQCLILVTLNLSILLCGKVLIESYFHVRLACILSDWTFHCGMLLFLPPSPPHPMACYLEQTLMVAFYFSLSDCQSCWRRSWGRRKTRQSYLLRPNAKWMKSPEESRETGLYC